MTAKPFASSADLSDKPATLEQLASGVWAYTAKGDPNVGAVEGDDGLLCVDARATPVMARRWLDDLGRVSSKPVRWLVLTHYHAVRTLGASAFGADHIVAHDNTLALIHERGRQDFESEAARMPRLFAGIETIPGLTWPTITFSERMTIDIGNRRVELRWFGRGHTEGDIGIWLPDERVLFAGDLVESEAALYTGDAFHLDWMAGTLDRVAALGARTIVGGRGEVARGARVDESIAQTRDFLAVLVDAVREVMRRDGTLTEAFDAAYKALAPRYGRWPIFEHCMPFNVQRAWDELAGVRPRIWTTARDQAVWHALQG